jgi:hypothetical protein
MVSSKLSMNMDVLLVLQWNAEQRTTHQKQIALKYVTKCAWKYRKNYASVMNIDDHRSTWALPQGTVRKLCSHLGIWANMAIWSYYTHTLVTGTLYLYTTSADSHSRIIVIESFLQKAAYSQSACITHVLSQTRYSKLWAIDCTEHFFTSRCKKLIPSMPICLGVSPVVQHPLVGQGFLNIDVSRPHSVRHTTLGRTPLDERSAPHTDLYLTTHSTLKREPLMPPAGFEHTIPDSKQLQAHALDSAATWIGLFTTYTYKISWTSRSSDIDWSKLR